MREHDEGYAANVRGLPAFWTVNLMMVLMTSFFGNHRGSNPS
jgi:hypothetical protein